MSIIRDLAILGVVGIVAYFIFKPRTGFHYFSVRYRSEIDDQQFEGDPGSHIPIHSGSSFGAKISFKHRLGTPGKYIAFIGLNVEGVYQTVISDEFDVGLDPIWEAYEIDIIGMVPFNPRDLSHCRLIDTKYGIYHAGTEAIAMQDTDADVYHLITTAEIDQGNCFVPEYWSDSGGKVTHVPGVAPKVIIYKGDNWGATVRVRHRYLGGTIKARIRLKTGAGWNEAEASIKVPTSWDWVDYYITINGSDFNPFGLVPERKISVYWSIYFEGKQLFEDEDIDSYLVIGGPEFIREFGVEPVVVREYYSYFVEAGEEVWHKGAPGSKVPIWAGSGFGGLGVTFQHRYLGGKIEILLGLHTADGWNKAWGLIEVPTTKDWHSYTTDCHGINFDPRGLEPGRKIDVLKEIYLLKDGIMGLEQDWDADCFITGP